MISSRFTSPSHFYEPAVDYVASRCFENVSQSSALSDRPSSHGHVNHDFTNVAHGAGVRIEIESVSFFRLAPRPFENRMNPVTPVI
ncbi:hypothetical protein CC2G_003283 [Coprinopsis cinerea AmutBmut pab1-1]|nr:hypothetical protein CC2G_003283 [Coprinopsis cinerea AmutBmut pab1-1]